MSQLSVRLLAGIGVTVDGAPVELTSHRQRTVVAALGLNLGRSVSTEQLIDALWADDPPDRARATLQTYVSRVRSVLGDDAVVYSPGGYRFADGTTSDVDTARALADEARAELSTAPDRAAALARRALDLWGGHSLAELADDPWFVPAALGLEELRSNLVDLAARALLDDGRATEAIELLEPAARAAPLREPTWVLLVRALTAGGRSADAVRAAERYRRQLRDETGLSPGADLGAAEQAALIGDTRPSEPASATPPADGPGTAPPPGASPAGAPPPGADDDGRARARRATSGATGATLPRASRMVGRERELGDVIAALTAARLVTVTGAGGVGKTRLVAQAVDELARAMPMVVVELAPVDSPGVADAVATALGLRADRASAATIAERLHDTDAVLVLDNAEHVLGAVRELTRTVLDRCPGVRLLVTSRSRLDLPDEQVVPLAPLATDGAAAPAVELFVDRLGGAGRGGAVDPADPDVLHICERLDGVPLALELAAGRAAVLGVRGLCDRLDAALDLASSGGADDRHGSLRRVVAWSYESLDDPARRLVAVLSVFEGEFDLDAAERVGSTVLDQPVSLLLGRLVDASLIATTGLPGRYRLLEMIRQFGRERLTADQQVAAARRAHARWVTERLEAIAAASAGPAEAATSSELDSIRHEVRSALRWAETDDASEAAALLMPLTRPLLYRPDAELIALADEAVRSLVSRLGGAALPAGVSAAGARLAFLAGDLDRVGLLVDRTLTDPTPAEPDDLRGSGTPPGPRHRAHHAAGVLALYEGRPDRAMDAFGAVVDDPAASLVDRLDSLGGRCLALCYAGRLTEARAVVAEHAAVAELVGSPTYRAFARYLEGEIELAAGDPEAATAHLRGAADLAWSVGASFVWGIAATVFAGVLVRHRSAAEAAEHLPVLVERWRRTATWTQLWTTARLLAELLVAQGRDEEAALILLAADGDPAAPPLAGDDLERDTQLRRELRERLGDAAFAGIAAGARVLDRVEVVDRAVAALSELDTA